MINEAVKGFNDYTGQEARKRRKIKEIIENIFELYGFQPAETPVIEYEEFVRGENQQDETISDIFKLQDKGKRNLALRYEFTFQLKRISQNKKLPFKRYQIGPVFRDEPVSANRFRQFTQCDIDIVGSSLKDEAEILAMSSKILKELGIKVVINVNNRKLLNEIMEEQKIKEKDAVMREIDKIDKLSEGEVKKNLKKYKAEKLIEIFKKPKSFFKKYPAFAEIEELEKNCRIYGIKINFQSSLARGLSYYNGTIFEIKTKEMKETICSGGSYSVNGINSTGISFGIERLSVLSKTKPESREVLVISINEDKKAIAIAEELRKSNIPCTIMFGKISKALEFANSYSIPYTVFVGKLELAKKKLKLRDMKTGSEKLLSEKQIIESLK